MTVNDQITDAAILGQHFTATNAPAQTQALLNVVMSNTVGMTMHNAVNAQRNSQISSAAAAVSTCARLLAISSYPPIALQPVPETATRPVVPVTITPIPTPAPAPH